MSSTEQQAPGIRRTNLQHDLSIPGREVVQNRVDISPEAPAFKHTHPAETIHAVKNVGTTNAAELATYVVEKGKPLLVLVQ